MTTIYNENVTGMILAGGKARRMGGQDKGLIKINGQAMIQYVLDALKPQVNEILINANRNISEYEKFAYPVISDQLEDYKAHSLVLLQLWMPLIQNTFAPAHAMDP